MDALLSVSMSLLGQAVKGVPQTPPQPKRRPMVDLTNVSATPEWQREGRRSSDRPSIPAASPPTPMTNLKLLTNIAAEQHPGASLRKSLFSCAPASGGSVRSHDPRLQTTPVLQDDVAQQLPLTPRGEDGSPAVVSADQLTTPVQQYHSVFDTPISQVRPADADRLNKTSMTPKLRWKKHASDVFPMSAVDRRQGAAFPQTPVPTPKPGTRKEKSLSVLCAKFLEIYPLEVENNIQMFLPLDETAIMLGTERRRIYDIVNVLESLHFSIKLEKNRYSWIGQRDLVATLGQLKGLALQLDLPSHLQAALQAADVVRVPSLVRGASEPALPLWAAAPGTPGTPRTPRTPLAADAECLTPRDRGDRTLGVLTQKFVMLLLVSDRPSLSQDVLARALLGQDGLSPDGQHKAKVRRLYDIANILQSVGLVGKHSSGACRRPAFCYTGPAVEAIAVYRDSQRSRHSLISSTPLSRRPNKGAPMWDDSKPLALPRPASLDDICQVTALERHRLFEQAIDGSRGKSVLKRRLAEVQRAQAEVKRSRPAGHLSPAQHSQLSRLGIKRILIRSGDGSSQEICVREAAAHQPSADGDGDGPAGAGSRLEAALRAAARPQRLLAPRQPHHQLVAYQLVPVVRTGPPAAAGGEQTPVPILYDEHTCLSVLEEAGLGQAALTPGPTSLATSTPETLVTPGTMTFIREAVSSGTIKTVCNMSLTPLVTPGQPGSHGRQRARPASRASRRLQME